MDGSQLLSLVFSFRNEEGNIPELVNRVHAALQPLNIDYEMIFVNDASLDGSAELLRGMASKDRRIKIINMSRRFGVYQCLLAGLKHAKGDAVVYMDTDLQDPPEVIPQMVEEWRKGADVAYTTRTDREGESVVKMWITKLAYRFLNKVSDIHLPVDSGDFKLFSRRVLDELLRLEEREPYYRGLVSWVGFNQVPVYYKRERRFSGKSHRPLFSRGPLEVFVSALTSFSRIPLNMVLLVGIIMLFSSLVAAALLLFMHLGGGHIGVVGVVLAAVCFLAGIQLCAVGTVGLYVGRIYTEVRNRPRYIIESTIGFE
jgi:dolichol-phosphate mannosyltransferase